MKRTLLALSLLAAFAVNAQTLDSTSGSNSTSGANSGSTSGISSQNSGNTSVTATGNEAASRSSSGSNSGATSGSTSGAQGNSVYVDQRGPTSQTVNATNTTNSSSRAEQILSGHTVEDVNIKNSGVVEQRASGGTYNVSTENVNYSGTQTIKNVPSIAMSGPASGPCTGVSGGISAAGPGFGIGLNGSAVMVDCRLRENTRVLGMGMQSLDGAADPQEKGEAKVMFMDAMRALSAYNKQLYQAEVKQAK